MKVIKITETVYYHIEGDFVLEVVHLPSEPFLVRVYYVFKEGGRDQTFQVRYLRVEFEEYVKQGKFVYIGEL